MPNDVARERPQGFELFGRSADVQIHDQRLIGYRVKFKIERDLKPGPNTARVEVYNLDASQRAAIDALDRVFVSLHAGYGVHLSSIFHGGLRQVSSERSGADIVTVIEGSDGGRQYRTARANRSFAEGTQLRSVLAYVASTLGVGAGNVDQALADVDFDSMDVLPNGTIVSGKSSDELTRLLSSAGLEWSIQDEALQVLPRGAGVQREALRLAPGTGLIGSPSVDSKGLARFTCQLIPGIMPGQLVHVDGEFTSGTFRVEKCTFIGDTAGAEWQIDCEGKAPRD